MLVRRWHWTASVPRTRGLAIACVKVMYIRTSSERGGLSAPILAAFRSRITAYQSVVRLADHPTGRVRRDRLDDGNFILIQENTVSNAPVGDVVPRLISYGAR